MFDDPEASKHAAELDKAQLEAELKAIAERCAALPDLDTRSPDEIIGYDEHGLFR